MFGVIENHIDRFILLQSDSPEGGDIFMEYFSVELSMSRPQLKLRKTTMKSLLIPVYVTTPVLCQA